MLHLKFDIPFSFVSDIPFGSSTIEGLASRASWIRPAETAALGYIMNTLANNMNENKAWNILDKRNQISYTKLACIDLHCPAPDDQYHYDIK